MPGVRSTPTGRVNLLVTPSPDCATLHPGLFSTPPSGRRHSGSLAQAAKGTNPGNKKSFMQLPWRRPRSGTASCERLLYAGVTFFMALLDALYALVIFLSAFLLFLVEPMTAKRLLPALGGSAAVWTTCLVFFQTALLAGYFYAHQ